MGRVGGWRVFWLLCYKSVRWIVDWDIGWCIQYGGLLVVVVLAVVISLLFFERGGEARWGV